MLLGSNNQQIPVHTRQTIFLEWLVRMTMIVERTPKYGSQGVTVRKVCQDKLVGLGVPGGEDGMAPRSSSWGETSWQGSDGGASRGLVGQGAGRKSWWKREMSK